MASETIIVADGLVSLFNGLTGLPETFTAVRVHEATTELPDLDTIFVEVRLGRERLRERSSRGKVKITQDYLVSFRRRIATDEVTGENATLSVVDDWIETMENVEDVATQGKFSTVNATLEGIEILANVDYAQLRENGLLSSLYTYKMSWTREQ